jgi:hypothetical protein
MWPQGALCVNNRIAGTAFLFPILICIALSSCDNTSHRAIEHNNFIVRQQSSVIEAMQKLDDAIVGSNQQIEQYYKNALNKVSYALQMLDSIPDFAENDMLKKEAAHLFSSYKQALNSEYVEIIDICTLPNEAFTVDQSNRLKRISQQLDTKLDKAYKQFCEAQTTFAKEYELSLTTSEIGKP